MYQKVIFSQIVNFKCSKVILHWYYSSNLLYSLIQKILGIDFKNRYSFLTRVVDSAFPTMNKHLSFSHETMKSLMKLNKCILCAHAHDRHRIVSLERPESRIPTPTEIVRQSEDDKEIVHSKYFTKLGCLCKYI